MIVRKILEEEYIRTQEIFGIAFELPMEREFLSEEKLRQIKESPAT